MHLGFLTGYLPNGAPYEVDGDWGIFFSHIKGYMKRFLVKTPWGYLRFHRILRADAGRDLHDHPFDFHSFILWGGYTEEIPCNLPQLREFKARLVNHFRAGDVIFRKAEDAHALTAVLPGTLTLVICGKKKREWGFLTDQGWVHWREYHGDA
jgi:hypothetical protein